MFNRHHPSLCCRQLDRERGRELQAYETIYRQREARKIINQQMRDRFEGNQERQNEKEDGRLEALRARRQLREELLANRKQELEITIANRTVSGKCGDDTRIIYHTYMQEHCTTEETHLHLGDHPELSSFLRAYTGREGVKGRRTIFFNDIYGASQFSEGLSKSTFSK